MYDSLVHMWRSSCEADWLGGLYYGFVIIRLSSGEELASKCETEVRKSWEDRQGKQLLFVTGKIWI
jgi:hypothetical protein